MSNLCIRIIFYRLLFNIARFEYRQFVSQNLNKKDEPYSLVFENNSINKDISIEDVLIYDFT